jgi:LysR family transcriptional activator of nhaA
VATAGSIADASRRLSVSQSTISEQVKSLEEFLETPLFDRRKGGLRLNHCGQRVLEHSKVMFKSARRMLQDLKPDLDSSDWVLEVGVSPTVSRFLTTQRLLPLFRLNGVLPRVRFGTNGDLFEDLLSGELDLVISENEVPDNIQGRVGVRKMVETPLVIVAAPALASEVAQFPDGLAAIPLLTYTRNSRYRWELDSWLFDNGLAPPVVGEVEDTTLLTELAKRGTGAAALPRSMVEESVKSGELIEFGALSDASATVFTQFAEVNTPDLVLRAVNALIAAP